MVEADVRVGGQFRTEMIGDDGVFTAIGIYQEVIPGAKLVFTHGWEGPDRVDTVVAVEFKEKNGGTEVTVTHERLDSDDSQKGHEQGWISTLKNLAKHISS